MFENRVTGTYRCYEPLAVTTEWSECSDSLSRALWSVPGHTSLTMPALKTTVSTTPILGPVVSGWSHFHDHAVLKTTVNATPILGPVVSDWSCFHSHACIEKNIECYTYTGPCGQCPVTLP